MKQIPLYLSLVLLLSIHSLASAASRGVTVNYRANEATNAPVAGEMQLYSNSYALVIGNDHYTSGWPRLSNAISDARMVAAALEERGFDVTLATDLTGREMENTFEDFFIEKGQDPDARLFVWYAGHGHTVANEGYLIPVDGTLETDRLNFLRRSLSLREFGRFVRLAQSKHVYTVFDSCFAGTIFNVARSAPPPAITRITSSPVRQFLSSGDAGQTVSDDGTFARLFVEALKGERRADLNADGYVTAEELGSFLTNSVSNYTRNKQVPRHGKLSDPNFDKGDFVFLASLTAPPQAAMPALPKAPTTSGFSLDDLQQRAVEEQSVKDAWTKSLNDMTAAFNQVRGLDTSDVDAAIRINAWERFAQAFGTDNPYSANDDSMRNESQTRIATLKAERQAAARQLATLQAATPADVSGYQATRFSNVPSNLDLMIVHTRGRKDEAIRVKKLLEARGLSPVMNETSDSGNSRYNDRLFTGNNTVKLGKEIAGVISSVQKVSIEDGDDAWSGFESNKIRIWITK